MVSHKSIYAQTKTGSADHMYHGHIHTYVQCGRMGGAERKKGKGESDTIIF